MDQKGNRISSVNDVYRTSVRTFAHDARGNMTHYDGMILTYNADNRLMSVTEGGSGVATYSYNGFGQRISKTAETAGGSETTVFLWDFDGNIIAEYDGTGALKAEYMYRGANRLAMADSAGEVYFYQNDRLGPPLAVTDKDNNAVWEATYLPFGQAMVNPNSAVENNFRFPGQYFDEETGLHYNYHRYYDPRTGRYVTADPIGLEGGINLYAYAVNNPVLHIDPYGLKLTREQGVYASMIANVVTSAAVGTVVIAAGGVTAPVLVPMAIVAYGFNMFTSATVTAYMGGDETDVQNSLLNAVIGTTFSTVVFPGGFWWVTMQDFLLDMAIAGGEPILDGPCQ